MFLHESNSSSSLYVRAFDDRASVAKSWSSVDGGDVNALNSPSQHVVVADFVTRSKSNRSLDEHFAKISGTQFADLSKGEHKIVKTELDKDESFSGGEQECEDASGGVLDGNGVIGDVMPSSLNSLMAPEKSECERNQTKLRQRLNNISTKATVKDVTYQNSSVEISGQPFVAECPNVIQKSTTTVSAVSASAQEEPIDMDKERPIPTLEPSPRFRGPPSSTRPNEEATETPTTSSRSRRWQSEDNRFRNVDSAKAGKFVREALVRRKKLEEMREKRLQETYLLQQRGRRGGRRAREAMDEEDQVEDGDEGGGGGGGGGRRGENVHARQMFKKWKETRCYSLPSELPSDFFKFASGNARKRYTRNDDEAEIDDEEDYYHYDGAKWNRNGNKATAPSKQNKKNNKATRESKNKRPTGNRAEHQTSTGGGNNSQVSVGTDNNEKISEISLRGGQISQQQQQQQQQRQSMDRRTSFPLADHQSFQDVHAKDSATFRDQEIGFVSDNMGQYRNSRSIAPPPRVQQPQTRLTRRYDTRDQGEKNNYEPLKSRRYPWKAAPFDYELKPTRIAREKQREFVPQSFRSRSPGFGEESDAAYRVRTPPWGFDKLNPNWEWETGKELRHNFSSQVKMPSVQRRARDIYLVHEDDDGARAPLREPSRAPPRAHAQAYQNRRVSLNDNNNDNDLNFFNRDSASWRRNHIRPGNSAHSAPPPNAAGKTIVGGGQIRQPRPIHRGSGKTTQGFTCGCPPRPDPSPPPVVVASANSEADVSAAVSIAEKNHNDDDDDDDDDDDERSVNFGTHANPTSASASPSATSADSSKSQKKDKKDKKKKKKKDKDKNDKHDKKKDKKKDEKTKKDKKKKDSDDDSDDYDEKQVKKFKSKETIVTRRKDRSTSKTAITKSEGEKTAATAGGASLWRSVSNVASIVGLLQRSRVSRDDSGSATYLRLRPKPCPCDVDSRRPPPPPPPPPVSRRGVCDGVCSRPRLREARDTRFDDFDDVRTEYDYLPVITPESTPPWYRNSLPHRRPVPPSPSPPRPRPTSARRWDRKTTIKDYWDLDVETEPRMRNRRHY